MAIAHDFVELYAGDVNTFANTAERNKKIQQEKEALVKMSADFDEFTDLIQIMQNYEKKLDEESLFVCTVDKMQALIMGDLDNWRPYAELKISYAQLVKKYSELSVLASPYAKTIFEGLVEYCQGTYNDQPAT